MAGIDSARRCILLTAARDGATLVAVAGIRHLNTRADLPQLYDAPVLTLNTNRLSLDVVLK